MTKEKVQCDAITERPKVLCVNCMHALSCDHPKSDNNKLHLCILTELEKVLDCVTGLMVYDLKSVKDIDKDDVFLS